MVFGVSLGNLVRGVPIGEKGLPGMPLFTNFLPGRQPGILDWYTGLVGLFTLSVLAVHGALYLVWRTAGHVGERSLVFTRVARKAVLALWVATTAATVWVRPEALYGLASRPWAFGFVAMSAGGLWGIFRFPERGRELASFLSSSAFLLGMVATALAGIYPYWLRSTLDPAYSLTASNALSGSYGMGVALTWWSIGILLAAGYFTYLFRSIRGKVGVDSSAGY